MNFTYRPLPAVWPSGERTPYGKREPSRFRADWRSTMELLVHELELLRASNPIVIEAGYREGDIRLDGLPRANARLLDPAVVISFQSRHGPLRYGCDTYHEHQANVRAIALALEALRAVDRYGVTKRGEQYTGWRALPSPGEQEVPLMSRADALAFLSALAGPGDLEIKALYRRAARAAHPDTGGSHESFIRLQQAKELLEL